jgi:hypothetical protein
MYMNNNDIEICNKIFIRCTIYANEFDEVLKYSDI